MNGSHRYHYYYKIISVVCPFLWCACICACVRVHIPETNKKRERAKKKKCVYIVIAHRPSTTTAALATLAAIGIKWQRKCQRQQQQQQKSYTILLWMNCVFMRLWNVKRKRKKKQFMRWYFHYIEFQWMHPQPHSTTGQKCKHKNKRKMINRHFVCLILYMPYMYVESSIRIHWCLFSPT